MAEQFNKPRRLLVLDDENEVAATICLMAETAGFGAEHTDDADIFLDKVVSWQPTHVAVDLQLVDRDGIEVIHQLAKKGCNPVVIIISGLGGRILDSSARVAAENGLRVAGVLSKPFSRTALHALLNYDVSAGAEYIPKKRGPLPKVSSQYLAEALQQEVFIAFFQPKVSCSTGKLMGYECLARWPQPDGSMIPPDQFISLAEQTGQINTLTRQIYRYALSNLPGLSTGNSLKYALNLSPINLSDESFPRWLFEQCRACNVSPNQIILEVTETASMDNPLALLENLTQFRIRGFQLSIDDFGVGYSSLVQLARLPFSELKIDQMFVKSLATSEESQKIVTAVVGLGKSLGLNVVAEGVEDEWALSFLQQIGCDDMQGYYIARPMDYQVADGWSESKSGTGK